jgi:hypothetical protein
MTHSDAGRYAAKHESTGSPDERIAAAVTSRAASGRLACAEAEKISVSLGAPMAEVGRTLDLLEIRIDRCQLGLFGCLPEGKGVRPDQEAAKGLEQEIHRRFSGGRLPCAEAWAIAAEMKIPRMRVSAACETLQIKIKPCQLGAF